MLTTLRTAAAVLAAVAMVCSAGRPVYASEAASSAPEPIVFVANVNIAAGDAVGSATIGPIPAGHYMVVQTVSFFRTGWVSGSIAQVFVTSTILGKTGYFLVPPGVADGSLQPGATLSTVFYAAAASTPTIAAYRSGSVSNSETDTVTVSGYLVTGSPSS
jgi:hypothetical protein